MSEILSKKTGELPEAGEINDVLFRNYNLYSGDFDEFKHQLDIIAPVQVHFIPTVTPDVGVAPKNIRDQWVGLSLPVRSKQYHEGDGEEGFVVRAREALEALKLKRPEAYQWWRTHYIKQRNEENSREEAEYEERHGHPYSFDNWRVDGVFCEPVAENPDFPEYFVNMDWFIFYPRWGVAIPMPDFKDELANEPLLHAIPPPVK